ncbi:hypothetical protein D9M68_727170 [compost metagenome]
MAEKLTLECGVHRYADGAQLVDGEPDAYCVGRVVEDCNYGLALAHPQGAQAIGEAASGPVEISEAVGLTEEIEKLAFTILFSRALQHCIDGVDLISAPAGFAC